MSDLEERAANSCRVLKSAGVELSCSSDKRTTARHTYWLLLGFFDRILIAFSVMLYVFNDFILDTSYIVIQASYLLGSSSQLLAIGTRLLAQPCQFYIDISQNMCYRLRTLCNPTPLLFN